MRLLVLVLVTISALFAIAGGIWVAIALVRAISSHRAAPESKSPISRENSSVPD